MRCAQQYSDTKIHEYPFHLFSPRLSSAAVEFRPAAAALKFIANRNGALGETASPIPWHAFPPVGKGDPGIRVKVPVLGSIENPLTVLSGALVAKTKRLSGVTTIRGVVMKPIPCPLPSPLLPPPVPPVGN